MILLCPACDEPAVDGADWCEACGADLDGGADSALAAADAAPCVSCNASATDIAADGYCGQCGHKQPDPRDHLEVDSGPQAMVSDRGKRHHRNEDFAAIGTIENGVVLVVCDGVSTTDNPEVASKFAADTARDVLVEALFDGAIEPETALRTAIAAAQEAVIQVPKVAGGQGSPSCTIVAAVALSSPAGVEVTLAWLGDSRAYWIDGEHSEAKAIQLTVDHSWATEQVIDGLLTAEQADADSRAHTITRWLGADAHDLEPAVESAGREAGRLLLCSDGLWNYAADDVAMSAQVAVRDSSVAVDLARSLVAFAVDSGGHDNITVAIADMRPGLRPPNASEQSMGHDGEHDPAPATEELSGDDR